MALLAPTYALSIILCFTVIHTVITKVAFNTKDKLMDSSHFVTLLITSQQTWSGFSPTTVSDNNRQSGFSPTMVPKLSKGLLHPYFTM